MRVIPGTIMVAFAGLVLVPEGQGEAPMISGNDPVNIARTFVFKYYEIYDDVGDRDRSQKLKEAYHLTLLPDKEGCLALSDSIFIGFCF